MTTVTRPLLPLLGLVLLAAPLAHGQDPKPGDRLNPPLDLGAGVEPIQFRYCPSGTLGTLDETGKPLLVPIPEGFYISETEISQQQFLAVFEEHVKKGGLKPWQDARCRLSKDDYLKPVNSFRVGTSYPIYQLGIHEVIQWCKAVEELRRGGTTNEGPVAYSFRIPTLYEWRYACRARQDPAARPGEDPLPYFNLWPKYDPATFFSSEKERQKFEDFWKNLKMPGPFDGSQKHLCEFLKKADEDVDIGPDAGKLGRQLLSNCLERAIGLRELYKKTYQRELQPVQQTNPNEWGIRHMHGNAAEWTLSPAETGLPRQWESWALERPLFVVGGHFQGEWKQGRWQGFTIDDWSGKFPSQDAVVEGKFRPENAGIRLMMVVSVSPEWFRKIREVARKVDTPEEVAKSLEWIDKGVAELQAVAPTKLKAEQPRLTFYKALLHLRARDDAQGLQGIQDWLDRLRASAVRTKLTPDVLKQRLQDLQDEMDDLALVQKLNPKPLADLMPKAVFYAGLLRYQDGDEANKAAGRQVVQDWLAQVRSLVLPYPAGDDRMLAERLKALGAEAAEIRDADRGLGELAQTGLEFTQALVEYRKGNRTDAARKLSDLESKPGVGGDEFYRLTGALVSRDRTGK